MRIAIGSDHAGYRLKEHFIAVLKEGGHDVNDLGTDSEDAVDYPIYCSAVGPRGRRRATPSGASCSGAAVRASSSRPTR